MAVHYTGLVSLVLSDICSDDKFKEFSSVFCLCTVLIKIFFSFCHRKAGFVDCGVKYFQKALGLKIAFFILLRY